MQPTELDAKIQGLHAAIEKLEQKILVDERTTQEQLASLKIQFYEQIERLSSTLDRYFNEVKVEREKSLSNWDKLVEEIALQLRETSSGQVSKAEFSKAVQQSSQSSQRIALQLDQINAILELLVMQSIEPGPQSIKPIPTRAPKFEILPSIEQTNESELFDIIRAISLIQKKADSYQR